MHLFEYLDDAGEVRAVRSDDVNAYLQIVLKGLVLIVAVSFYARRRV